MKKTLTLLALTTAALMPMMPLTANGELITVNGVKFEQEGVWSTATGWFDANKSWSGDGLLCWAATSSNLIAWWQSQNPDYREEGDPWGVDEVWDVYKNSFVNDGGIISKGVQWWFDGTGIGTTDADLKYKDGHVSDGGYYAEHLYGGEVEVATPANITTLTSMEFNQATTLANTLVKYMRDGYAVGLNFISGKKGHAETLWGIEYNPDTQLITRLYISDSDDSLKPGIRALSMGVLQHDGYQAFYQNDSQEIWEIESFVLLSPTITNDVARFNVYNEESGEVTLRQELESSGYKLPADTKSFNKIVYDNSRNVEIKRPVNRHLTVDEAHDGAHIGTVQVDATQGVNLLEVQKGVELTVENVAGSGLLTKTGEGTLKIAKDTNTSINVKAGVMELNGDASAFTGAVTVDGGTLLSENGALGDITLNNGGTLQGSGKFKNVTVNGGTLSVGDAPAQQKFTDKGVLTLSQATLEFYVAGWERYASSLYGTGWSSGTYSNIDMSGANKLDVQSIDSIIFYVGGDALKALSTRNSLTLDIVDGINSYNFQLSMLEDMAANTKFIVAEGAPNDTNWQAGQDITQYINFEYKFNDNSWMYMPNSISLVGSFTGATPPAVPEPTTSTLSLLALASLCARRRRK